MSFFVPGNPAPQGSMRIGRHRRTKKPILLPDNRRTAPWRSIVARAFVDAIRGSQDSFPLLGPVGMRLSFALPRPRKVPADRRGLPCVHPDLDKLERAMFDALTGIAYVDDGQVCQVMKGKYYAPRLDLVGVHVQLASLDFEQAHVFHF